MMAAQMVATSHRSGVNLTRLVTQEGSPICPERACVTAVGELFAVLAAVSEGIGGLAAGTGGAVGLPASPMNLFRNCRFGVAWLAAGARGTGTILAFSMNLFRNCWSGVAGAPRTWLKVWVHA